MVKQTKQLESPFVKAKTIEKRLKLLLWGAPGTGKTLISLKFPKPVVIDMEHGTDWYGDGNDFDVIHTIDPDECMEAGDWLTNNKHDFRTLVVDPITIYWAALQDKYRAIFMERRQKGPGYKVDFYDMQVGDWPHIKSEYRRFIRKQMRLDMNFIVTAHQKKEYADNEFMKVIGDTFDGEKATHYAFDTIVQTFKKDNEFWGRVWKQRAEKKENLLPTEFPLSYEIFEKYLGKDLLTRKAESKPLATKEQVEEIKNLEIGLEVTQTKHRKLLDKYQIEQLEDLNQEEATGLIDDMNKALEARKQKASS